MSNYQNRIESFWKLTEKSSMNGHPDLYRDCGFTKKETASEFIESLKILSPKKVVYISCSPDSLARDLGILKKNGFKTEKAIPVDMFPFTRSIETVVLLTNQI